MAGNGQTEALKRLEELRPRFEALKAERIRAESDIERLTRELEVARAEARATLGTDDSLEIEQLIEAAEAENRAAVDAFAQLVRATEERLRQLAGEGR